MEMTNEELVRRCYQAYETKDREAIEPLLGNDFHFTSPLDNRIDRDTYFKVCWPNSRMIDSFDIIHLVVDGDNVFATYEGRMRSGSRFRNTEVFTVRDGKIRAVEVYFGWSIPHPVKAGTHTDTDAKP